MKFNKIFIAGIFLLAMLTVGVASASDSNITQEVSVSNLEIDNSVIANHSADGMIYISSASLIINNTVFDNNNANLTDSGTMGFIFATGTSSVTIESSNFTNNIDRQGLIYDSSRNNNLVIKDSLFDNNVATVGAGGVVHSDGKVNIANSVFDEMVSFASYAFNKSHAAAYARSFASELSV